MGDRAEVVFPSDVEFLRQTASSSFHIEEVYDGKRVGTGWLLHEENKESPLRIFFCTYDGKNFAAYSCPEASFPHLFVPLEDCVTESSPDPGSLFFTISSSSRVYTMLAATLEDKESWVWCLQDSSPIWAANSDDAVEPLDEELDTPITPLLDLSVARLPDSPTTGNSSSPVSSEEIPEVPSFPSSPILPHDGVPLLKEESKGRIEDDPTTTIAARRKPAPPPLKRRVAPVVELPSMDQRMWKQLLSQLSSAEEQVTTATGDSPAAVSSTTTGNEATTEAGTGKRSRPRGSTLGAVSLLARRPESLRFSWCSPSPVNSPTHGSRKGHTPSSLLSENKHPTEPSSVKELSESASHETSITSVNGGVKEAGEVKSPPQESRPVPVPPGPPPVASPPPPQQRPVDEEKFALITVPDFREADSLEGLFVWRIEGFGLRKIPESNHGKFYSGNAYIVLSAESDEDAVHISGRYEGGRQAVYYWIGNDAPLDVCTCAAFYARQLASSLTRCKRSIRQEEDEMSEEFLLIFPRGVRVLDGSVGSALVESVKEGEEVRLFRVAEDPSFPPLLAGMPLQSPGAGMPFVEQVDLDAEKFNSHFAYVLSCPDRVLVWKGSSTTRKVMAKAFEMSSLVKDFQMQLAHKSYIPVIPYEEGHCDEEFWDALGGKYHPVQKERRQLDPPTLGLYRVSLSEDHKLGIEEVCTDPLAMKRSFLLSEECYLLEHCSQLYVWFGRKSSALSRKAAMRLAETFKAHFDLPEWTLVVRIHEGSEPALFQNFFLGWTSAVTRVVNVSGDDDVVDSDGGAASHERLLTQMANLPSLEELSKSAHLALNSLEIPSTFQPGVTISTEDEGEVETEVQIEVESSWPIPDTHLLVCMCTPQTYCIHPLHPLLARRCGVWMKLPSLPFQMTVGAFSSVMSAIWWCTLWW